MVLTRVSRWLDELESKDYVTGACWLVVALAVGLGRMGQEALVVGLPASEALSLRGAVNFVAFYVQIIWVYTAMVTALSGRAWQRALGPVLVGTLLGLLPPLVDVLVYGIGRFYYYYQLDFRWVLGVDLGRGIPLGEALAGYISTVLLALYVGARSGSHIRSALAFLAGHVLAYVCGVVVPSLAYRLALATQLPTLPVLTLGQILLAAGLYGVLNPHLLRRTLVRLPHVLPSALLALLGGAIGRQPVAPVLLTFAAMLALGVIIVEQNDLYDEPGRETTGGAPSVSQADSRFGLAISLLLVAALGSYRPILAVLIGAFYALTLVYHHPATRCKSVFPVNYLLIGLCALAATTAGILSSTRKPSPAALWLGPAAAFLAFGLGSVFKDYKDVDSDVAARNNTAYTLAGAAGRSLAHVHRWVVVTLTVLTVAPCCWLAWRGVPPGLCLALLLGGCIMVPVLLTRIRNPHNATESTLWLINGYLLIYALLAWHWS